MQEGTNKAVRYDKMVKESTDDELGLFEKYDEVLSEIRHRIVSHKAVTVLDIGCGTGNLCGELSDKIDVIGIDKSTEMISFAKEKYNNMKFTLGDFLDKPFRKNDVDVVVTTYAFHSLTDDQKKEAIKYMLQYIKDDGKIIIGDFMFLNEEKREKCKSKLLSDGRQDLWDAIDCKHYTNLEEFQKYIISLGCKIQSKHIVNFTWIVEIKK